MGYYQRTDMYWLLPEDRDVWFLLEEINVCVITRGKRCMGYYQKIEMNGLLLEERDVWVITRGQR